MKDSIRLMRLTEVKNVTGLGRSTIYQMIKNGEFPSPIKASTNISTWISSEVDDWVQEKIRSERASQTSSI